MKPAKKWVIGCGLGLCLCCGSPLTWLLAPGNPYPVGSNINDHGLTQDNSHFIWSPRSREPIKDFARRRNINLAHFFGSIELSRAGSTFDRTYLQFLDGVVSYKGETFNDEELMNDMKTLQKGRLSNMLATSRNDWRIVNHNKHFIDPQGPFTGTVSKSLRGLFPFYVAANLEVKNDLIIRSDRSLEISLD